MSAGKIVTLKARPSKVSLLAFETAGVVGDFNVEFGQSVAKFDYDAFYSQLGTIVAGSPEQLKYDSQTIYGAAAVQASLLVALRGQSEAAALDKAIGLRANACYQKYLNKTTIIAAIRQAYDSGTAGSKPLRLAALAQIAQDVADKLNTAYTADGRLGVVKATEIHLTSTTNTRGDALTKNIGSGLTTTTGSGVQNATPDTITNSSSGISTDVNGVVTSTASTTQATTTGTSLSTTSNNGQSFQNSVAVARTQSCGDATQVQASQNTDYAYRIPSLETAAQNERAQISLIDEQLNQFMTGQALPYLEKQFRNELQAIDFDVKRLQSGYLNTLLMSPIDGVITGIFKYPGTRVRAGEPIVRVEDNLTIYLVGTVVRRGMISIGDTVKVQSPLFSGQGGATQIKGTVVAARGHRSDDDRWDLIVSCDNDDGAGSFVLPLHYRFDRETTSIDIS